MVNRLIGQTRNAHASEVYGLSGNYDAWSEALAASSGYDSAAILHKTRVALLQVRDGTAVFERDSVLFDTPDYSWPLVAGLLWAASRSGGKLNVLDFGGSLGSTYFQTRGLLAGLTDVRWNIVEQAEHVAIGKSDFENDTLHFYGSISECMAQTRPNAILLSSVLQYIEHPYTLLEELMGLGVGHVIVDRTPFAETETDRLCVQTVPPAIYSASYPAWIFSREKFESKIREPWQIAATFQNSDWMAAPIDMGYHGFLIGRHQVAPA